MTDKYQPKNFEKKWIEAWRKEKLHMFNPDAKKSKFYDLVELPYTSGDLHIGHWFTFVTPDVLARFKRMTGRNVFFPMGYDAFGLPAENAAIKHKIHPRDWTLKNIETMTEQFQHMGTMIDWDWMTITCLPEYYRWNQWIFLKLFEKGLAYRGKALSNWCPSCQTVLANENVVDGRCWRCDSRVVQKEVDQWFIKITDYAEKLIWPSSAEASDGKPEKPSVDWPMAVRVGQNNWIGKKEGINMEYPVKGTSEVITCFTTAPVNFGMTFIVLAPDHKLVKKILARKIKVHPKKFEEIKKYVKGSLAKTEQQRLVDVRDKSGVSTGLHATNRIAGWDVPVWISDFVVAEVGTGAVQGCPGHDHKDFEFAKKFGLPIIRVVIGPDGDKSEIDKPEQIIVKGMPGKMVNSKSLDGLSFAEGLDKTMDYTEEKGWGKRVNSYHLRDWSISRQRYWGTPVPMIHCSTDGIVPVSEKDLPVELPYAVDFTPKGKPPLASNAKWLKVKCPKCGGEAMRDAETLDTFFDSAWYWFRYLSPKYENGLFDKELVKKFTPVEVYFGGAEHTLGHTLYARFFTKFFKDIDLVDYDDEFALKRVQHGIVLGPDGNKMSKSKGNVINPDEAVREYGADTVRMYLCFMMPYEGTGPWSDKTIAGVNRFLNRVWKIYTQVYGQKSGKTSAVEERSGKTAEVDGDGENKQLVNKLNKTIKKVTHDIENIKMNTAIAAMMEFLNQWESSFAKASEGPGGRTSAVKGGSTEGGGGTAEVKEGNGLSKENAKKFLQILSPFAPFTTEEIWRNVFGEKQSIHLSSWPKAEKVTDEIIIIPVQVNGKLRSTLRVESKVIGKEYLEKTALSDEKVKKYLIGKNYRTVYVPGKILNFVVS